METNISWENLVMQLVKDSHAGIIEILKQDDNGIFIVDTEGVTRDYPLWNPDTMDESWMRSRILATPAAASKLNTEVIAKWIIQSIPKPMYFNLQRIVFVDDPENDFDWLMQNNTENFADLLEEHDLPSENQLGVLWWSASILVISIQHIERVTEEMIADGLLYEWEKWETIEHGILTTMVHEIRHLAQSNPYLPDEILQQTKDDETDAEMYARELVAISAGCNCYRG